MPPKIIDRRDGRIEIPCKHGCGHPSKPLSDLLNAGSKGYVWQEWMDVHGCCGCCDSPEWIKDEQEALKRCKACWWVWYSNSITKEWFRG